MAIKQGQIMVLRQFYDEKVLDKWCVIQQKCELKLPIYEETIH